jgi:hypothetical protein
VDLMVGLGRLALFAAFAIGFLTPVALFCRYRRQWAEWRGDERGYVAHQDPWLPALTAVIGTLWIVLLSAIR